MIKVLYKISKSGKVQVWESWVDGNVVYTKFGQQDGKQQTKTYNCTPKNVGKTNETTSEAQALVELKALYEYQVKNKHYRYSLQEAKDALDSCRVPMKILNYKDHKSKVNYPCYVGIKYNGSRAMFMGGDVISKAGIVEDFKVNQIKNDILELGEDVDTEIYKHGFSLQRIQSARNKANDDTGELKAIIFDVPTKGLDITQRVVKLEGIRKSIASKGLKSLVVEVPVLVSNESELNEIFNKVTPTYEGVVIWNLCGYYEFGVRSNMVFKWKPRFDSEAKVLDVTEDKNGNGKLHVIACDELNNVKFKVMMKVHRRDGEEHPRDYNTMKKLIGSWITFSYEELSDKGVPTKPVGENVRKCNDKGEPLE